MQSHQYPWSFRLGVSLRERCHWCAVSINVHSDSGWFFFSLQISWQRLPRWTSPIWTHRVSWTFTWGFVLFCLVYSEVFCRALGEIHGNPFGRVWWCVIFQHPTLTISHDLMPLRFVSGVVDINVAVINPYVGGLGDMMTMAEPSISMAMQDVRK